MVKTKMDDMGRKAYAKILYWGPYKAGKTTIVETLHQLTTEEDMDITAIEDIQKTSMAGGSTLYFDKTTFRSNKQKGVFYEVYTTAGRKRFSPLRKKIFRGTDGVIFVIDSQKSSWDDNLSSLKELIEVTSSNLIKKIPLIVMLNKKDLPDTVQVDDVKEILSENGLIFDQKNPLFKWNPIIYESVGLYEKQKNVYTAFVECARRVILYSIYGSGYAPDFKIPQRKSGRINFILPKRLKEEWEIFAKEILNTSLSQMIRNAVREYRNKYKQLEEKSGSIEMRLMEMRMEKMISEKMEKMMAKLKTQLNKEENRNKE